METLDFDYKKSFKTLKSNEKRVCKLFYREETYQQNQSSKQEYNSKVFAYANAQMAEHYGTPEGKLQLKAEYEAAHHIGSSGKTYGTPWSWKFNSLQFEYRQSHPFGA